MFSIAVSVAVTCMPHSRCVCFQMNLWFDTGNPSPGTYDRITNLKKILFDIFADHTGSLSKLEYVSMVSMELWIFWLAWINLACMLFWRMIMIILTGIGLVAYWPWQIDPWSFLGNGLENMIPEMGLGMSLKTLWYLLARISISLKVEGNLQCCNNTKNENNADWHRIQMREIGGSLDFNFISLARSSADENWVIQLFFNCTVCLWMLMLCTLFWSIPTFLEWQITLSWITAFTSDVSDAVK